MNRFFSVNFWIQTIVSTFITMLVIFAIKKVATQYNIPVVSTVAEGV